MSFADGVPWYQGVLNYTPWGNSSDATALSFPTDAIVGVYVQAFTPIVTLDSQYLSLVWSATSSNAPYTHGTLDVDATSRTTPGATSYDRMLKWATLVRSFITAGSRISLSTPDAAQPYTQVSFSWPSPTDGLVVLSDTTDGLRTLAAGSGGKYLYQDSTWQQVGWGQLSGVPTWLNATYTEYGVTYATTTTAMGTTGAGTSTSQFLRSGGGAAAPDFKQVDMKDLTGITWDTGLNKVAYTPDGAGKTLAFSNAVAASKYLGYNSGVPGFVAIPYTDISGTPTLPTVSATANQTTVTYSAPDYKVGTVQDIGTGSSPTFTGLTLSGLTAHTALYADASKIVKSATINTLATKMYLQQYSSGDPQFVQVSCADLTGTLPIANGGTNKTSWTQYALLYADTTASLSQLGLGTSGYVLTSTGASSAPSFQALPTAVTVAATANQTTVSGGPAYTVGTVQNIDTAADVRFGYLSVGSARASNYANRITNTATAAAAQSPFGLVFQPTLSRADTSTSYGYYFYPTFSIGSTTGGTVYGMYLDTGAKSGGGSITSAVNLLIQAPTSVATNGLALQVDSIGVGNAPWTDTATASGTIKANRVGIGQNPDATKVLVVTGDTSHTGALSVSGVTTATGGVNYGDTTLTKYKVVTGATTTMTYNGGTGTLTYDYVIIGKHVTINFHVFAVTTGGAAAVMTCTLAAELSTTAAGHATLAQVNSTTQPGAFVLSGTSATFGRFDGSSLTTYPASTANCGLWDSNVSFILY